MILDETLIASLSHSRQQYGSNVALIFEDEELTYAELDDLSWAFAASLMERGVEPGDRVVLHMPNSPAWVIAFYGGLKAGCVVVPVNYALTEDELRFIIQNCKARILVIHAERSSLAANLSNDVGTLTALGLQAKGFANDECLGGRYLKATPPAREPEPLETAMICYTSGTTGNPKGAMLSHRSLGLNAKLTALMHGRSSHDVVVSALPLAHVYGHVVMNATFQSGGKLALLSTFDAGSALRTIENYKATMFEGVPTMYLLLLAEASSTDRIYDSMRLCTVGGQAIPVDKMKEVEEKFGCPLVELWGMTELAGLGTTHPFTGPYRHGSIGTTLPFLEARIDASAFHENGNRTNAFGELLVRGPQVMLGYYENAEATADAITEDGWLRTGDIAKQDNDGFFFIVDRKKDVLLCGGYNVYPAEIENVISKHPAVAMVAVSGRNDQLKGDLPQAFIVLKQGANTDEAAINRFCRVRLAAYKVPRDFHFVTDLPKTSTGKVLRRALRDIDPKTLQMDQEVQR